MVPDEKVRRWLLPTLLWTASAYIWILPLFRPRASYGWGHFRLVDIYVGVPLVCGALCATVYALGTHRHKLAFRLTAIFVSTLVTVIILDLGYVVGVQRILSSPGASDFWFDSTLLSREANNPDPELGFSRKPGLFWEGRRSPEARYVSYRTDERGFRNKPGIIRRTLCLLAIHSRRGTAFPKKIRLFSNSAKSLIAML